LVPTAQPERPLTALEKLLCQLLTAVLGVQAMGVHDNFFDLGGDSILAMKLCSEARKQHIPLTVAQVYRLQTVAGLAVELEGKLSETRVPGDSIGLQPFLPVQQQLLVSRSGNEINRLHHFNMASLFSVPDSMSFAAVQAAARALLERHPALRLRFGIESQVWCSRYRQFAAHMLESVCHRERVTGLPDLERRCRAHQEGFDLSQAPLLRLVRFELPAGTRLLLLAHHSVVDVPSWHILVSDLRAALRQHAQSGMITLGPRPASYQEWGQYLQECASNGSFAAERDYWLRQIPAVHQEFHCERPVVAPFTFDNLAGAIVKLTQEETFSLLRQCQAFYAASINEILLAALYCGLCRWSRRGTHSVFMESHGRHSEHLDLAETVGWFTQIYPLALEQPAAEVMACIDYVKQKYRSVPNHGLGYGVLRYLCNDSTLTERSQQYAPQVVFNYFGQLDGFAGDGAFLEITSERAGPIAGPDHEMLGKLIFQGGVYSGCLTMRIEYDQRRFHPTDIGSLADAVTAELRRLTAAVMTSQQQTFQS
jgi:non-ribosomal peptide synthase protein (TIGR01720 family)